MPNRCGKFKPVWKDINILKLKEIFLINLVSWLMGILNLVFTATCFCSFPWRWYRQSISKCFFVKSQCQSPFPLNPGISWKWTDNSLFWLEYLSVLCLKVSIYQFCRKQLTKLANLLVHSQCALSEPISSSRKTRKLTVCRFI